MTKIIVVAGGKGGVGKTFIAVNLAYALYNKGSRVLLVDADVENPSVLTIVKAKITNTIVSKSFRPVINYSVCDGCGICVNYCPEHALVLLPGKKLVFYETLCGGCSVCKLVCPQNAIDEGERREGVFKYGIVDKGFDVIVGELEPGNRRSIVLITKLIEEHKKRFNNYDYVVIDSPPGTGAGLYSILRYATHIVAVTEPTPLGISDLTKFLKLIEAYKENTKTIIVVNKYGLSAKAYKTLEEIITQKRLPYIRIPYTKLVQESYTAGQPLILYNPDPNIISKIEELANLVKKE
ncbi:P-loop NTPase [Desulfurococcaceae archaeon MEX13E-LK6-19]|nr:P-loop NTPase [Desulfurococcaceae archaeon MEX13E-LK6-19]